MSQEKIKSFEGMRFIAAIFVLLSHLNWIQTIKGIYIYDSIFAGMGAIAVSVFFVMGGYLRYRSLEKRKGRTCWQLALSFFRRFLPVYLVSFAIVLPLELPLGVSDIPRIAVNLFLLQAWFPASDIIGTFGGGWYLSVLLVLIFFAPYMWASLKSLDNKKRKILLLAVFYGTFIHIYNTSRRYRSYEVVLRLSQPALI